MAGELLFATSDKYDFSCGWFSSTKLLESEVVTERFDISYGMVRTKIRSCVGGSHLGHLFYDDPKEKDGYGEYNQHIK